MIPAVDTVTEHRRRAERLFESIHRLVSRPTSLMEVCGTHTMAIGRFGLRARLPKALRLLSGPGCPVCVTTGDQIDRAIAMAREPDVSLVTFGDMMRVPGSRSSLQRERAVGRDVRVIYSPLDALDMARAEPERLFVLFGIGFETTSPTIAATLLRAAEISLENLLVLPTFKRIIPAMRALAGSSAPRIDGFICPGHVSTVIGSAAYESLVAESGIPCVITGFEALDILEGIERLLDQARRATAEVEVQYARAVRHDGNRTALRMLDRVFSTCDADWRGLGRIPHSGFTLSAEFRRFDALGRIPVALPPPAEHNSECACGDIMRGARMPPECALFGSGCTPDDPQGPCMVSGEGACAAYYRYGE